MTRNSTPRCVDHETEGYSEVSKDAVSCNSYRYGADRDQSPASRAANEPLRVGSILSVTGPAAFLGEDMKAGLQLAVDEINDRRRHRRPKDRLDIL